MTLARAEKTKIPQDLREPIIGGSPDKTDFSPSNQPAILFNEDLASSILVPLKNDPKDSKKYTKVSAASLLARLLFVHPQDGKDYHTIGISNGGDLMMLRELVYNELMGLGKTEAVAKEWGAVAEEFEQVCGLKQSYARADVMAFLTHLRKRGLCQSTIQKDLKAIKVVARVQGWQFPKLPLRRVSPDEIRRTILSKETIDSIITLGKHGLLKDIELCYLALATTYGLRRVEMARLKPSSFPDEHHLIVDTAKGGSKTTHLIPPEIAPYLTCFKHYEADSLTHMFHRIARKLGLDTGGGYGWHSIRRSLATELSMAEVSTLNVLRFMRWSDASSRGEFTMLTIYAKKDQEKIDSAIFKIHPFIGMWRLGSSSLLARSYVPSEELEELAKIVEETIGARSWGGAEVSSESLLPAM